MTFWCGSGSRSADPCLWLMDPDSDPDPDPAIFVIDLQDASKKLIFSTTFSACYFLKIHLHYFSKIKCQKESQNSRIQGFSFYFCMMIEGSGSRAGSGSIPLTSGSGSERPKNMWIRWIRIRIRIRNTEHKWEKKTLITLNDVKWNTWDIRIHRHVGSGTKQVKICGSGYDQNQTGGLINSNA